jgi:hypothetical protein
MRRGQVCRLQLLLALASAVICVSQSRRARGNILLSQIRDFPFRRLVRLAGLWWRYCGQGGWGCWQSLLTKSHSQSYITTDGQPASLSWNKAPIWGLRPDLDYCLTVAGLFIWGALSDGRTGLPFAIATGLASAVIFGSEARRTRGHILLSRFKFEN